MRDWPPIATIAVGGILGFLLGVVSAVVGPASIKLGAQRFFDTAQSSVAVLLHRPRIAAVAPTLPSAPGATVTPTPTPTPATAVCFAVPPRQTRTQSPRSAIDEQRWHIAEIRCRSQPPIAGKDAFLLLNAARRLLRADDEADRCWSLALALPGGEAYLAEAPGALMSENTSWSEVYRKRFSMREAERLLLQDRTDDLVRDLCRKHYNESDCVWSVDDETGEPRLCPLSLGGADATGAH